MDPDVGEDEKQADVEQKHADARPEDSASEVHLSGTETFRILLGTIAEASKHARGVLFVLTIVGAYVTLAAAFGGVQETGKEPGANGSLAAVKLPVVDVNVPIDVFLFCAPVLVLLCYAYLHIYVRELRNRIHVAWSRMARSQELDLSPRLLLYPWILGFAESPPEPEEVPEDAAPVLVRWIAALVIWWMAPAMLLTLWWLFVREEREISFVPFACIVLSVLVGSTSSRLRVGFPSKVLLALVFLGLGVVTLASLPAMRTAIGPVLESVWRGFVGGEGEGSRGFLFWVVFVVGVVSGLFPCVFVVGFLASRSWYPSSRVWKRIQVTLFAALLVLWGVAAWWLAGSYPLLLGVVSALMWYLALGAPERIGRLLVDRFGS